MKVRQPAVALLYMALILSPSFGCSEAADPLPDAHPHILKNGFRNTNPAFTPPSLWDRLKFIPSRTWATTFHPLQQYGLKLRFVDVDLHTLNMDVSQLAAALTPRTRMLMAVNILGNPAALDRVREGATGTDNLLYPMKEALRTGATVGEVCNTLRGVFGQHEG